MPTSRPGRHRVPRTLTAAPVVRCIAMLAASGGLVASMSAGSSAAPVGGAPAPATPSAAPASPAMTPSLPVPAHPVSTTLRWGSRGGAVKTVQRIVGTDVDGIFGPKTHAAVQRWQARHGLVADGIVGPITSRHMGLRSSTQERQQTSASRTSASSSRLSGGTSGASGTVGSAVLAHAAQYTGIAYQYGGSSPATGFDCSGYTQYVFSKVGIRLPRTAEAQRRMATRVSQPRPGDLVFWGAPAYHMAIYAGDGMIYDSGRSGLTSQKRKMFSGVTSFGRVG